MKEGYIETTEYKTEVCVPLSHKNCPIGSKKMKLLVAIYIISVLNGTLLVGWLDLMAYQPL